MKILMFLFVQKSNVQSLHGRPKLAANSLIPATKFRLAAQMGSLGEGL